MKYMTDWKRNLQLENSNMKRIRGMIGFAMRAGALVIGTELIAKALARGGVRLVVIASDASDATKKKLTVKSKFYDVTAIEVGIQTDELGRLLGKTYAPAAVAVTDEGFATEIKKAFFGTNDGDAV